jgi:hypothetical protein
MRSVETNGMKETKNTRMEIISRGSKVDGRRDKTFFAKNCATGKYD